MQLVCLFFFFPLMSGISSFRSPWKKFTLKEYLESPYDDTDIFEFIKSLKYLSTYLFFESLIFFNCLVNYLLTIFFFNPSERSDEEENNGEKK